MVDKKRERDSLETVAAVALLVSESDDESHAIALSFKQSRFARLRQFANISTLERVLIFLLLVVSLICLSLIITQNQDCTIITTDGKIEGIYGVGDTNYMTRDHAKDVLWNNVSGTDLGLTWSAHGNQNEKETLGQIAMLHQLGCLASIREAIQDASEGREIGMDWKDNDRWPHCLDYLRKVRSPLTR